MKTLEKKSKTKNRIESFRFRGLCWRGQVTSQAEGQIQEIIHYIAHELKAPDAALHLLDILEDTFALFTDFSQRVVLWGYFMMLKVTKRWDELFDSSYRLSHKTIRRIIHKLL